MNYLRDMPLLVASAIVLLSCKSSTEAPTAPLVEAYLHTRASWAPRGDCVAYSGRTEVGPALFLVDTSGSNQRKLLDGEGVGVRWSPTSDWLVFSRVGSLYKVRDTGDSLARLTTGAQDIRPAWSPAGNEIAFYRNGVAILDLATNVVRTLFLFGDFPSWHPNSSEVVTLVVHALATQQFRYSFRAVNRVTGADRHLTFFYSSSDCAFPSISPNGTEIVFSMKRFNEYSQIWKITIAADSLTQLTFDAGDHPSWSPDGAMIVYTRTLSGDGGLWIMNADGSGKRRLTRP